MAFLFDILKDNSLVDNQTYIVSEQILKNNRLGEVLLESKRRTRSRYKNEEIYNFLFESEKEIKKLLKKKNNSLVLFNNKEYEHNTEDHFYELNGKNWGNFTLKTGNIVGLVKKGDYQLKISSRFGDRFLKHIISDADGFLELKDLGASNNSDNGYEWLLIYLWKIKLQKALRLGLPKEYKSDTQKLTKVRGSLNVVDYFLNKKTAKYVCTYREHSYNNLATQIIVATFNKIKGHSFLNDMHSIKNAFLLATEGQKAKHQELYNTGYFSNPYYSDYNTVIDLSKQILKDDFASFGEKTDQSAFLFDVSMLFEYYIYKLFKRNQFEFESKFSENKTIPRGGSYFSNKRKLQPDIVIRTDQGVIVLDVKYKYYDVQKGVDRNDIFQVHTYAGQYSNDNKVLGCGFVYPLAANKWEEHKSKLKPVLDTKFKIMNNELNFSVFFLIVPDEKNMNQNEYIAQFKQNEVELITNIQKAYNL